ncbi:hypothetical protein DFP73DRAFT_526145 [Morchella snyderi]|nr:hypothetical protein DFP73DRAFT_526145 [Morchella snyderi]
MSFLNNLISDFREAKAAAQSHNMASYEPPSASGMSATAEGPVEDSHTQTSGKPASESYIPPPPPKNLPHGWTARYDEKEGGFLYSKGVDTSSEQRDFPTEKNAGGSTVIVTGETTEQVTAKPV